MNRKEKDLRKFGRHLTALRLKKGLNIQELATAAGIDPRHIQKLETGEANPLFTTLLALARGFDIPPETLLDFT